MNLKRFKLLLNEKQINWNVNHINYDPITKTATLNVNHIGKDPGKLRQMLKMDEKFIREQAADLIETAQKHGPKVSPKIKRLNVQVV